MNRLATGFSLLFLLFTNIAHAQTVKTLVGNIIDQIINPLVFLISGIALIYFLWGVTQFIMNASNEEERKKGQQHILWGLIGLAVMFSVWGLVKIIKNTVLDVGGNTVSKQQTLPNTITI